MPDNPSLTSLLDTLRPNGAPESAIERFTRVCEDRLALARAEIARVVDTATPATVDNVLVPHNRAWAHLEHVIMTSFILGAVHPDPELRAAAETCEQAARQLDQALERDPLLHQRLLALDTAAANPVTRHVIERLRDDCRRAGAHLDEAARARLAELDEALVRSCQRFEQVLREDVRSIRLTEPGQWAGLPTDYVAAHRGSDGTGLEITTRASDYATFMAYAEDGEARRRLYTAFQSRGYPQNEAGLREILALRQAKAELLGYPDWATFLFEDTMAGGAEAVTSFLEGAGAAICPRMEAEYAELLAFKREHDDAGAVAVAKHEESWLRHRLRAERYAFDAREMRPYLPYARVEQGMLGIAAELYGLAFWPALDAPLWHPDVRAFDVLQAGTPLARVYLDMHPRPDKYQHVMFASLQSGLLGAQLPEGVIVANFPQPGPGDDALLEPGQVKTLFHEFGHLLHHILGGQQPWLRVSGIRTEEDFTEVPSKLFEAWATEQACLARFARHAATGEPLPPEMVEPLVAAERVGVALAAADSVFLSWLALRLHARNLGDTAFDELVGRLQSEWTPFAPVDGTHLHTCFGHLVNYSAQYYTYLWSEVIAQDFLGAFRERGLMDPACHRRYRDSVLAAGGSRPAADLVQSFLGRPFDFAAYQAHLEHPGH